MTDRQSEPTLGPSSQACTQVEARVTSVFTRLQSEEGNTGAPLFRSKYV